MPTVLPLVNEGLQSIRGGVPSMFGRVCGDRRLLLDGGKLEGLSDCEIAHLLIPCPSAPHVYNHPMQDSTLAHRSAGQLAIGRSA